MSRVVSVHGGCGASLFCGQCVGLIGPIVSAREIQLDQVTIVTNICKHVPCCHNGVYYTCRKEVSGGAKRGLDPAYSKDER